MPEQLRSWLKEVFDHDHVCSMTRIKQQLEALKKDECRMYHKKKKKKSISFLK